LKPAATIAPCGSNCPVGHHTFLHSRSPIPSLWHSNPHWGCCRRHTAPGRRMYRHLSQPRSTFHVAQISRHSIQHEIGRHPRRVHIYQRGSQCPSGPTCAKSACTSFRGSLLCVNRAAHTPGQCMRCATRSQKVVRRDSARGPKLSRCRHRHLASSRCAVSSSPWES